MTQRPSFWRLRVVFVVVILAIVIPVSALSEATTLTRRGYRDLWRAAVQLWGWKWQ